MAANPIGSSIPIVSTAWKKIYTTSNISTLLAAATRIQKKSNWLPLDSNQTELQKDFDQGKLGERKNEKVGERESEKKREEEREEGRREEIQGGEEL